MSDLKKITIEVSPDIHAQIRVAAAKARMSMSKWIVTTITEASKEKPITMEGLYE